MDRQYANGAFSGELHLVLLLDKARASTREGRQTWALQEPFAYYTHAGDTILIPAGYVTDLASIPRPVTALFIPSGGYSLAAVVHDFLCSSLGTGVWHDHPAGITRRPYTSAEAAMVLREAMDDLGVPRFTRFCIWAAVRLFGPQWS